jgi:molybdopterin-synthase adenylyltransferase
LGRRVHRCVNRERHQAKHRRYFDYVEKHDLDRLSYATRADIGWLKVEVIAEHLTAWPAADPFRAEPIAAVYEDEGFRVALDCDVLTLA